MKHAPITRAPIGYVPNQQAPSRFRHHLPALLALLALFVTLAVCGTIEYKSLYNDPKATANVSE